LGLRRQAERDAALEKDRTLIHPAKALSSLRFAGAVQMLSPLPRNLFRQADSENSTQSPSSP
jgi:hypothetical protein